MKQIKVDKPIKSVVTAANIYNLDQLGIPKALQLRKPNGMYFPTLLNPDARVLWTQLFINENLVAALKELQDPFEAWQEVLAQFIRVCDADGKRPFTKPSDSTVNNQVRNTLANRRMTLKRYLDRSRLFTAVKVLPMTVRHKYEYLTTGNIKIHASLQFEMASMEDLRNFLQSSPLHMHSDGNGFVRNLLKTLTVRVSKITTKRATISYEMEIRFPYYIPEELTTLKAKHAYLDREFFFPTVKGYKLETMLKRVTF